MRLFLTCAVVVIAIAACRPALGDAQRAWCAEHPRSVATAMENLRLLTPVGGLSDEFELWVATIQGYFTAEGSLVPLTDQQEADVERGCAAAYEGR